MNDNHKARRTDNKSLIKRCLTNDRRAQLLLYDRFSKTMYNSSLRLVKNTMEAEDIVQESFISAFKSLSTFRNDVPFEAWLRRIVINKSLDHLRKKKLQYVDFEEDEIQDMKDLYFSIDTNNELERKQKIERIRKEVMKLPDGFRIIFSLFYYEGFDHKEISDILEISASTSRSQLTRAKQKVINALN